MLNGIILNIYCGVSKLTVTPASDKTETEIEVKV